MEEGEGVSLSRRKESPEMKRGPGLGLLHEGLALSSEQAGLLGMSLRSAWLRAPGFIMAIGRGGRVITDRQKDLLGFRAAARPSRSGHRRGEGTGHEELRSGLGTWGG